MRWEIQKCPKCGKPPDGTLEVVQGLAVLISDDDGGFDYEGTIDIWWDSQESVRIEGLDVLVCEGGHEWHTLRVED